MHDTTERCSPMVMDIDDPDELTRILQDTDVRYLRLAPEPYAARITCADLESLRFQSVDDGAHASHGVIDPECIVMLYGLSSLPQDIRINGAAMATSEAIILGPGSQLECRVPSKIHWASLSFNVEALHQLVGEKAVPRDGRFLFQDFDPATRSRLVHLTSEIDTIAAEEPFRLGLRQVRKGIAETFLNLTCQALRSGKPEGRWLRTLHRRVQLVADAEDLVAAQLGVTLYSEDVCVALGVSPRTLHDAFLAVHSMSLHRYLHLRRLNQARTALQSGEARQVKAAALAAGFWNLGRFSQAYRSVFGEFPSQTLERSRGQSD